METGELLDELGKIYKVPLKRESKIKRVLVG